MHLPCHSGTALAPHALAFAVPPADSPAIGMHSYMPNPAKSCSALIAAGKSAD